MLLYPKLTSVIPPGHIWAGPKSLPLGSEVTLYCQKPQAKIFWGNTKLAKWSLLLPIVLLDILLINFRRCNSHKGTVNGNTLFTCYGQALFSVLRAQGLGEPGEALLNYRSPPARVSPSLPLWALPQLQQEQISSPANQRICVCGNSKQKGNLILLSPAWWGLFSPQFRIKDAMGGHWYS